MVSHFSEFSEQLFHASKVLLCYAPATSLCWLNLRQRTLGWACGGAFDQFVLKDSNPHLEVPAVIDQHMFLSGKEPKKVARLDLVPAISK